MRFERSRCLIGCASLGQQNVMSEHHDIAVSSPVVAVIDDDVAVRGSLKFALEIEGYSVRTYARGADLLDDGNLAECSCFIVDQKLPGMTGLELIATMRQRHIEAPMILITSDPTIIVRERAAREGVPIVEKPLLGNALLERVQDVIARRPGY
jgi:two-component system response regulator FixJ